MQLDSVHITIERRETEAAQQGTENAEDKIPPKHTLRLATPNMARKASYSARNRLDIGAAVSDEARGHRLAIVVTTHFPDVFWTLRRLPVNSYSHIRKSRMVLSVVDTQRGVGDFAGFAIREGRIPLAQIKSHRPTSSYSLYRNFRFWPLISQCAKLSHPGTEDFVGLL